MKKLLALLLLVSSYAFGGTVTGQITTATSGPIINGTLTLTPTQAFVVTGTSTVVSTAVACYTDASGNVVGEPNPLVAPVVTPNTSSGTLAAGTYFTRFVYQDASGTSFYSFETTTILTATGSLVVTAPVRQPATATGYQVFISTSSSTETLQGTITGTPGSWANYTQSSALVAGSALPASNTTACKPFFSDQGIPGFSYLVGLTNSSGANVSGFPQKWRLFGGAAGTVNLSLGMPISDGTVVYPQPIISTPALNATQSINGPLNLNGFGLTAGTISGTIARVLGACDANTYSGSDGGAKINAAEADATCITVDATNLTSPTAAATVNATKPLTLGAYTLTGGAGANPVISVGAQSALIGAGMNYTIVTSTSNTNDIVKAPAASQRFTIHDLTITQPVTRTAGAALRLSGGNASIYNFYAPIYFDGIYLDTATTSGNNQISNFFLGNAVDSGSPHCGIRNGGVSSGTVASNQFSNGVLLTTAVHTDALLCMQDGSDTILFSNVQAVWDGVHSSVALHTEVVNGGLEPFAIKFVNSVFEGGTAANSVVIDKSREFTCVNCNEASGLKGVVINGGVSVGSARFDWRGGVIQANQQHGVDIEAGIGDINILGVRFADNGKQTNNTYDHIFNVGASNFHFNDNFFDSMSPGGVPANIVKFDIENGAGACTNYTMTGNNFSASGASGTLSDGCTGTNKVSTNLASSSPSIFPLKGIQLPEGANPTAVALNTTCNPNSSTHQLECANNGGTYFRMTQTIGSGTATMTTAAITGPNCGSTVTIAATGVQTSDIVVPTDNAAPAATTNGPLVIKAWPTANNVNFAYCVQSGTFTPAAATINWRVTR